MNTIAATFRDGENVSPACLNELVERRSDTGYGGFVDLNNDLGVMVENLSEPGPSILMPYFYARRIAAAGMFHQGAIDAQALNSVGGLFFNYMVQVGAELTQEEQVAFQESSLDKALELCKSYLPGITRKSTQLMLAAAQEDISVRGCLAHALKQHYDGIENLGEPVMYREGVMKPEYCAGYFATGRWEPGDDFEASSEKVLKYFASIGVSFGQQDGGKEETMPETDTVSYKNRNYALISQCDGLYLFEDETQAKWHKYLVHVPDRQGSPYAVAWNGQRFSECTEQERFRRQAPHAEQWAISVLKECRSARPEASDTTAALSEANEQGSTPLSAAFDLLLFDLDNTLIRSNDLQSYRGSEFCRAVPAGYVDALKQAVMNHPERQIYTEQYFRQLLSTFPGLKVGVVTQAPRIYAETILLALYPSIRWSTLVAFDDVTNGKPHPEGIFQAMAVSNVSDSTRVAMVGDSVNDMQAAYFGGCWTILDKSGWESYNRTVVEKIPDAIIKGPQELEQVIEHPSNSLPALEMLMASPSTANSSRFFRVDRVKHMSPLRGIRSAVVHVLGRSFSQYQSLDGRRSWHPLTAEILRLKDADVFPDSWISALSFYIREEVVLKNQRPVIVTAIPAKPGRTPRLQYLLQQLEKAYASAHPGDFNRLAFMPGLLGYAQGVRSHHGEHLSRSERFSNAQQHLMVDRDVELEGLAVVVIDDVVTTGATLLVAKQALIESGANQVRCIALAKAVGER